MAVPVRIFNASNQSIMVTVNQGQQFIVNGTGPAQDWAPQSQNLGTGPSYSPGPPQPNVVGNSGRNMLECFVGGSPIGGPFTFQLPQNYPVGSVQIFLFFRTVQMCTFLVLTDGMLHTQQTIGQMEGDAPPE